jgi:hypothetical protein
MTWPAAISIAVGRFALAQKVQVEILFEGQVLKIDDSIEQSSPIFDRPLKMDDVSSSAPTGLCPVPSGDNLVRNPNFAVVSASGQVCGWSIAAPFSRSTTVALPGSGASTSLMFDGSDPKVYHLASQHVPGVQPNQTYRLSASVITRNLSTEAQGYASLTRSWRLFGGGKHKGEHAGGTWPHGPSGTSNGWVQVLGHFVLPATFVPGSFVLAVYVRPNIQGGPTPTGQAWFDNVSIALAPKPCPAVARIGDNLVRNPNFAVVSASGQVCGWSIAAPFSRSTTVALPDSGASTSLMFNNTDPKIYHLASQHIPEVLPGITYLLSANVITQNLKGHGGYASVVGMWENGPAEKKVAGGTYPHGPGGTSNGWVSIRKAFTMPAEAAPGSFTLAVYARPFLSGDPTPVGVAFFANISIVHTPPTPIWTTLMSPAYRGRVRVGEQTPVLVRVHFSFDAATRVSQLSVAARLHIHENGSSTGTLWRSTIAITNISQPIDVDATVPVHRLSPDEYQLTISLHNGTDSDMLAETNHNLTVLAASTKAPLVSFDERARLMVNGSRHPFFPLGFYAFCKSTMANRTLMSMLQRSPFNVLMPYGECTDEDMNVANSYGMKVVFSLKDIFVGGRLNGKDGTPNITNGDEEELYFRSRVAKFRRHPSLLAWYLNDEKKPCTALDAHYSWMITADPDHPTWQVVTGMDNAYLSSSDANGVDYCKESLVPISLFLPSLPSLMCSPQP